MDSPLLNKGNYAFGPFVLDPVRRLLMRGQQPVALTPTVFDLLLYLVENAGRIVTKDELFAAIWPNRVVSESSLSQTVFVLRRALNDAGGEERYIATAPGRGYRWAQDPSFARTPEAAGSERSPFNKPFVAVLPFANLTGDRDRAYFADGLTEEISRCLSRTRTMFVVAGSSSPSLKGKGVRLWDAARELGVQYLVEGSVRKAGGRLRVAAKLIDANGGPQLWGDHFDETPEDLFALQDRLAIAVTGGVEPAVVAAEMRWVLKHPSDNPGSYELYLRGLRHCRKRDREEYRIALDFLSRAIAVDPNYRLALALAAHMHSLLELFGWADDPEANRARGSELAYRAIMLAGDDAVVLAHAGTALSRLENDRDAARDLLARAVAINPGSSYAWFLSGLFHAHFGDADTAIAHLHTSLRLEPLAHRSNVVGAMATSLFRKGRFDESVAFAREAVQTADGPVSHLVLAAGCAQLGQASASVAALSRYRELSTLPVEEFAGKLMLEPAELKLFLEGIAAAEAASQIDRKAAI